MSVRGGCSSSWPVSVYTHAPAGRVSHTSLKPSSRSAAAVTYDCRPGALAMDGQVRGTAGLDTVHTRSLV